MRRVVFAGLLLTALLSACAAPDTATPSSAGQIAGPVAGVENGLQAVLATSEIVVGPNRIALGLIENNVPIPDIASTALGVRYYRLEGDTGTLLGEEQAHFFGAGLGERGVFVLRPSFERAGMYGLELDIQRPGHEQAVLRMSVEASDAGTAPRIGTPAPRSVTPTAGSVSDLHLISSASEPDARLYQVSVADAVSSGKPSLVLFATPGYCRSQVCGPGVEVLQRLVDRYGDAIAPVHVEVYKLPYENGLMVPAMREWGLQSEPWLFLVDRSGNIAGRFEGGITFEELEPEVARLVSRD